MPRLSWPNGRSEMAARVRDHDWAATPLGAIADWPCTLRTLVDTLMGAPRAMMLAWGPDMVMVYNDAYARCLGERHPAALGLALPRAWPEGWPHIAPMAERVFAGEHVDVEDMPLCLRRGGAAEDTWWTFSLSPVWNEAHAVAGMLNVTVDTTAQVQERRRRDAAERLLRESEARHRLLIGSWAQAVWETDANGIVVADSPSWRAYTGQTLDEWLGYGWLDAIHPDDRDHAGRQWHAAIAARGLVDAEFRLRAPGGGWRWTNVRAAPVIDAAGDIEKWAGMNIDIDARRSAEAGLRESESRLEAAFESVPAGIAVVDLNGRQVIGNREYRRLLASEVIPSRDPAVARQWQAWGDDGDPIAPADYPGARALRGEHVVPGLEMCCTRDDGSAIWTNVAAVPTFDARGQINGFVCAISDITERKRADAVLRERGERERSELKNQVRDGVARNQASRDLLQAAIDASTDMIQVFEAVRDERGEIVDFVWVLNNHTAERRYGEVRGESLLQRNPGVVREGIFDTFKRVVETGVPTQSERYYAHEQFDGWFYQSVVRLGDGVATTTKDIDAWKAAQAELLRLQHEVSQGRLRESEERFRLLVESVRDYAIFTTDTDGFITAWPAGAANVYGWSEQDILGRSVDLTFVPEDIVARQPQRERALAVREGVAPNIRWHLRSDGSRIFIDGSTQPLTGSDGTIREFIKIGQDVTEARRVQQALSDSERWQRALIEGIPQLVWRAVDRGHWTWASPQWSAFTGQAEPASHDLGWLGPVHPDDRDRVMTIWDGATRRGEFHADYRIWHVEEARHRWFQTRASPVRNEASEVVEWLGTSTDIEDMRAPYIRCR